LLAALLTLLVAQLVLAPHASGEVAASVTPSTGLANFQTVTVTVTGMAVPPPVSFIGICQGDPWGPAMGSCSRLESQVVIFRAPASGEFSISFTVRRFMDLTTSGRLVDCADPAEDCRVNVGLIHSIYGPTEVIASIPISFAPVLTDVVVTPDADLVDGQTVAVAGAGFTPGAAIVWCQAVYSAEPGEGACGTTPVVVDADAGGGFSGTHQVVRFMDVPDLGETVDCIDPAVVCVIAAAEAADIVATATSERLEFRPPLPRAVPGVGHIAEGDSGTTEVSVPITLSAPWTEAVTVDWRTLHVPGAPDFQADEPADYTASSGTLTFAPGETAKAVTVPINGDTTFEPDEYVVVSFANPRNAVMGGYWGLGFGVVVNDESLPAVVPDVGTAIEGDSGSTGLSVPVSLSNPSSRPITVEWTTAEVLGAPDDQAEIDDFAPASGVLTFAPGQTTGDIAVSVNGDDVTEADEYFVVVFGKPTSAVMGGFWGLGFGVIHNDD
jgi:hypothetical protein